MTGSVPLCPLMFSWFPSCYHQLVSVAISDSAFYFIFFKLVLKDYIFHLQILLTRLTTLQPTQFTKLVISNKTDIIIGSLRERKNPANFRN